MGRDVPFALGAKMKTNLPGMGTAVFLFVAAATCPTSAATTISYGLVDATAMFNAIPSINEMTPFTLNIDGTFAYDTATLKLTSVDITLSGNPVSSFIDDVLKEYTTPFTGIVFSGNAFSAVSGDVAISLRFANPLGHSAGSID